MSPSFENLCSELPMMIEIISFTRPEFNLV